MQVSPRADTVQWLMNNLISRKESSRFARQSTTNKFFPLHFWLEYGTLSPNQIYRQFETILSLNKTMEKDGTQCVLFSFLQDFCTVRNSKENKKMKEKMKKELCALGLLLKWVPALTVSLFII